MNKISLSLLATAFSLSAFSQSFTFSKNVGTITGFSSEQYLEAKLVMTNNDSSDIEFTWQRLEQSYVAGWLYAYCDPATCYDNSSGIPSTATFTIKPGKQGIHRFDVYPSGFAGKGNFRAMVYRTSQPSFVDTITYNIHIWNPLQVEDVEHPEFSIYPNPAQTQIRINYNSKTSFEVKLVNSIGQLIRTHRHLQGENSLDVANLPKGVYIVQIHDNGMIFTNRFFKN